MRCSRLSQESGFTITVTEIAASGADGAVCPMRCQSAAQRKPFVRWALLLLRRAPACQSIKQHMNGKPDRG